MFKKILYPIDVEPGDLSQASLPRVVEMARQWDAELVLAYVLPGFGMPLVASFFPAGAEKKMAAKAKELLDDFCKRNIPADVNITPFVTQGTPYEEILQESARRGVDLIVMPDRGRARTAKWLMGPTATKVVHHATCAVLVLRGSVPLT